MLPNYKHLKLFHVYWWYRLRLYTSHKHRVIPEETLILGRWSIVDVRKSSIRTKFLILNGNLQGDVWISRPHIVRFLFLGEARFLKRKVDTRDESLGRILDAAVHVKRLENQMWRKTRDLRTRVAQCVEVDGTIFEYLLRTATHL